MIGRLLDACASRPMVSWLALLCVATYLVLRFSVGSLAVDEPARPAFPRVYVHNASFSLSIVTEESAFGQRLPTLPDVYDSNQHNIAGQLALRLRDQQRCVLVSDAARADLIVIILVPPPLRKELPSERNMVWDFLPNNKREQLEAMCTSLLDGDGWLDRLHTLRTHGARRHVLLNLDSFPLQMCARLVDGWDSRLQRTPIPWRDMLTIEDGVRRPGPEPIVTSPLVSSVHVGARQTPPWQARHHRPILISFGASLEGTPNAKRLRQALAMGCARLPNATCTSLIEQLMSRHDVLGEAMLLKSRSIFCLEPPGFGPHRKSAIDSLLLGCIPVLFTPEVDAQLWPAHWGGWRDGSRLLYDADAVLSGRIDVFVELQRVPAWRIAALQANIARWGHRLHYSIGGERHDAVDITLRALIEQSTVSGEMR